MRESITEELESAAFEYGYKFEGEGEISVPAEGIASQPQTTMAMAMAKAAAPVAESKTEPKMSREMEAGVNQRLYLYGIADANAQTKLGEIGIEGNEVYTIPYKGLSAIVHNCPLEPYKSEDEKVVKGWVKTHQHVLDVVEEALKK